MLPSTLRCPASSGQVVEVAATTTSKLHSSLAEATGPRLPAPGWPSAGPLGAASGALWAPGCPSVGPLAAASGALAAPGWPSVGPLGAASDALSAPGWPIVGSLVVLPWDARKASEWTQASYASTSRQRVTTR